MAPLAIDYPGLCDFKGLALQPQNHRAKMDGKNFRSGALRLLDGIFAVRYLRGLNFARRRPSAGEA